MKLYIATRYAHQDRALLLAADLVRLGHEITSRWLMVKHGEPVTEALRDLTDLRAAEGILLLTEGYSGGHGGMWVELGYALGKGKKVYLYGPVEQAQIFCHLPQVSQIQVMEEIPL